MKKNKPNDQRNIDSKNPYNYDVLKPAWFDTSVNAVKKYLIAFGQFFVKGYKKYDAFIRRLFKLEDNNFQESTADNTKTDRFSELRSFSRHRNKKYPDDVKINDESDTQDYSYMPDYLKQKKILQELESNENKNFMPVNTHEDEDHHLLSIFKKRQRHRSFSLSVMMGLIKIAAALILILGVSGIGAIQGIANAYVDTTPALDISKIENREETSFIYDGNGDLITDFVGLENRISASIDEIPKMLQYAFIAIEDERFYTHKGIDIKRIFGAFFNNIRKDTTHGGSTITQQLIKLRILSREQTYKRKLQEAYLATELEKVYTKDQILETYLNTIDLGSGNYGVKAAARDYFDKELDELTLRECAMIAGIANSPYFYNPRSNYYSRNNPKQTDDRTNQVLFNIYKTGYISRSEYEYATQQTVYIVEKSKKQQMYDMPYFLEYAVSDVISHFIRQRNLDDNSTNRNKIENELRTSGYHIYTTVDPLVQQSVENSLYNWDKYPLTKYESDASVLVKNREGTSQKILQPQAAAVVFDYHTGQLKAIVGGRSEPTVKKALNRAYDSHMPVGSSIKPLSVYGPALNKGIPPSAIILDLPIKIPGWTNERGYPNNYGGTFSGPITMREAMYRSVNMAAVRILTDIVSHDDSYRTLETLGITSSSINKDGSGLALGTSGITVLEMAVAYGAIGNKGTYIEPISFTRVVDSKGNVLLDASSMQIIRPVFSPSASWLLVDMMKDVIKRGTGGKAKIDGITVAGKTGTNSDFRGVYFAGLTPYYSSALWVGHDNYKPLYRGAQGGRDAAPLWQDYMSEIHHLLELDDKPIIPDSPESLGLVKITTCPISGKLITPACEIDAAGYKPVTDYVLKSNMPTETCDVHLPVRICIDTNFLSTEYCPETDPYSYIIIPSDSIINELSDEDFELYFPTGIKNFPDDPLLFNENNPEFAHLFCPIHTLEWHENIVKIESIINISNLLIQEVESILIDYADYIDDEVKIITNDQIKDLKEIIKTENYNLINISYQNLLTIKQTYLDPIVSGNPEPTPEPDPEPEG